MSTGTTTSDVNTKTKHVEADYSAKQYFFGYIDGTDEDKVVISAGASEQPWIMQEGVDGSTADALVAIATSGRSKLKLGNTVAPGDKLTSDGNGKGIATTTPGDFWGATALEVGVADDVIEVEVGQGLI